MPLTFGGSRVVKTGEDTYDIAGTLSNRGVAKEISLTVTYLGTAKDAYSNVRVGFETRLTLNRKDFGLRS